MNEIEKSKKSRKTAAARKSSKKRPAAKRTKPASANQVAESVPFEIPAAPAVQSHNSPLIAVARIAGKTAGRFERIADKAAKAVKGAAKKIRRKA